jgi:hypothetical protein
MPSKPPRSDAAKKAAKTAKKLPNEIRKRWKVKRLLEEKEDLYWSQKKMKAKVEEPKTNEEAKEESNVIVQSEARCEDDDEVVVLPLPIPATVHRVERGRATNKVVTIERSNKKKKVQTRRLSKAQQRERVDLSLN